MPSGRIMIVDDEPDIIRALTLRLRAAGYEVIPATDGVSATHIAVREKPDVIILDIGLPGGDGHTVAERLRDNHKTMGTPVIYLTARNSQADMKRASELGAAGYLIKPFNAQRLLDLVSNILVGATA